MFSLLTLLFTYVFPDRVHVPENVSPRFWFDSILWLLLAFCSGVITYQSARPFHFRRSLEISSYIFAALIVASLFVFASNEFFHQELSEEVHWYRGPCGIFIFIVGGIGAAWLYSLLKDAAPLRLAFTASWGAVSMGAIASFFMHLVCLHESSTHAFIWHFFPVVLLLAFGMSLGRKLVRW
jgi:hypothetical protein